MTDDSWKPNLFVPGFAKSGSTALVDYLRQHNDIFVSTIKEPFTLSKLNDFPEWINDPNGARLGERKLSYNEYRKLYSKAINYKYRVDGSQPYTFTNGMATCLKNFSEDAKVLTVLRDPKKRVVSAYLFLYNGHKKNFRRWLEDHLLPYIDSFLTYSQVVEYYKAFGDNFRVIMNRDLTIDANQIMRKVFEYLKLEPIDVKPVISNPSLILPPENNSRKAILRLLSNSFNMLHKALTPLGLDKMSVDTAVRLKESRFVYNIINKDKDKVYESYIENIPRDVVDMLNEDFAKTIEFITSNNLMLGIHNAVTDKTKD